MIKLGWSGIPIRKSPLLDLTEVGIIHGYDLDKTIRKTFAYVLPNCLFYPAGTSNYRWSDLNVQVLL